MNNISILFLFFLGSLTSCTSQNCLDEYKAFTSFEELKNYVKESFDCKTTKPKSSWIDKLYYCECGNDKGYLIMETKRKSYIHKPISSITWNELQDSDDVGSYYARNIKGKYKIRKSELSYN